VQITIAETGYVGISNGILSAQHNEVVFSDNTEEKLVMLYRKESLIEDADTTAQGIGSR
jgi:UDP-glucose 6-dehydrogenase